jgi:hypothetical protein
MAGGDGMVVRKKRNGEIEVTQEIPIPVWLDEKNQFDNFELKVSASRKAWTILHNLSLERPEYVGKLIYLHLAEPAFSFIKPGPRFRGINTGREIFVLRMKELIPPVYYWIFWWLKEPPKNWSTDLSTLVEKIKGQPYNISGRRSTPDAAEVTAFLFEKYFGKERKKNGLLKWTDDPERFRRTFISNSPFAKYYKNLPKNFFLNVSALPRPSVI